MCRPGNSVSGAGEGDLLLFSTYEGGVQKNWMLEKGIVSLLSECPTSIPAKRTVRVQKGWIFLKGPDRRAELMFGEDLRSGFADIR